MIFKHCVKHIIHLLCYIYPFSCLMNILIPICVNSMNTQYRKPWIFPLLKCILYCYRHVALLKQSLHKQAANLRTRIDKCTIKISKCAETYVEHYSMLHEYDPFLVPTEPSNPWTTDSTEFWEMFEKCSRDQVAERRVRRWGFSCWDLLRDPVGHDHFKAFLEKEYATENLFFVEAVWRMKKLSQKDVAAECQKIWQQFLAPGAEMLVNVDSTSHNITRSNMENPDRWTFDVAAAHLYYLMTSDSYSRYLRSSHYKECLEGAKKKSTRTFNLSKLTSAKLNNIVSSASNSMAT